MGGGAGVNCSCPYCTAPFDHEVFVPDDIEELEEKNQQLRLALIRISHFDFAASFVDSAKALEQIAQIQQITREALE